MFRLSWNRAGSLLVASLIVGCGASNSGAPDATGDASQVFLDTTSSVGDIRVDQGLPDHSPADSQIDQGQPLEGNSSCALAEEVILIDGEATVSGDTSLPGYGNEFQIRCDPASATEILSGPQAYYRFAGVKDQWYKLVLAPSFTAYIYAFTSGCDAASIEVDCQSGGATGTNSRFVPDGTLQAIYIKAPQDGDIYVAVDSVGSNRGPFTLDIMEFEQPINRKCIWAKMVNTLGTKVSYLGNTGPALTPDEFPSVQCKNNVFKGPQVYFKFFANEYAAYVIELIASESQYLYLYVFGESCDEKDISADCSSGGTTGDVLATAIGAGQTASLIYVPPAMGWQNIAVDSAFPYNHGGFTIAVSKK